VTCPHCHAAVTADARFCPACGKAASPTESGSAWPAPGGSAPELVGREIAGRYRILTKLGEGGMGAVYRGEQISLKRAVAVKLLRSELSANQTLLKRFNAEAEAVAKLSHPNTVNIYDFGQDADGSLFIAMEFIEGRSLRSAIQTEGPFSPGRAFHVAQQVAASLSDAHAHAIVHRDLKPDNVMLQTRGRQADVVRVLDFGIAKLRDDSRATQQAMTQAGDMLGTPQYMAPEQIRGETIDGRTDVYALGCMLYEMLTARLPFEAPTIMAMLTKHLTEQPVPPSLRRPDLGLSPAVDQLVLCAMAKEPAARPASMDQLGEMIAALISTLPASPNRSGALGIPGASSAAAPIGTPPAPSAFHPPSGFQPSTPPPPGFAPPGIAAPPAPAPAAYTPAPVYEAERRGSRAPLYAILAVLVLGGGGAAAWFATQGGSSRPAASIREPDHVIGVKPIDVKPADPPEVIVPSDQGRDPWGDRGGGAQPGKGAGTAKTPIPRGATIKPPKGFDKLDAPDAIAYIDWSRGIAIAMAPLYEGTNDPDALARRYADENNLTYVRKAAERSAGKVRDTLYFTGEVGGVTVVQIIVLYITSSYRLGVLVQVPALLATQPAIEAEVARIFDHHVKLP
jgi:eukaryotic-like serine/threonine-protein kinase